MRALLNIYLAQFKTSVAVQLQYRVAAVIWLLGTVVEPVVYLVVWTNVAQAQGGSTGGFTIPEFAAYYIVLMLVNHLTFDWHMWEYDYRIREGLLSPLLLRPLHPIHNDVADNLAYKLITLSVIVPAAIVLTLLFRPQLQPPLWAVLAGLVAIAMAFAIRFLSSWALALTAFWTTRVEAVNNMYFTAEIFFAGRLAPLALLPVPLQVVASLLPFRWALAFPVELLLGRLTPRETVIGLGAQVVWLFISLGLVQVIWRAGIQRYSAFGA